MRSFDAQEAALPSTALTTPASHDSLASPGSGDTEMSNSSYREISWTTMFDHFLEGRKPGEAVIDKVIYFHPDLLLFSLRNKASSLPAYSELSLKIQENPILTGYLVFYYLSRRIISSLHCIKRFKRWRKAEAPLSWATMSRK
jgi:hypothetical protein